MKSKIVKRSGPRIDSRAFFLLKLHKIGKKDKLKMLQFLKAYKK